MTGHNQDLILYHCRCLLPAHSQPRYHSYVDKEQEESNVHAIFQKEAPELKSSADLKAFTIERLVGSALNRRLFRLSRQLEPPFYAASVSPPLYLHLLVIRASAS